MARNKREAFERLATQRTNAVLEKLRVLGNCANSQLYDYTDEDVRAIFRAIKGELRTVEAAFNQRSRKEFKLKQMPGRLV
jgi:CHASE1-domain containing sensor protein